MKENERTIEVFRVDLSPKQRLAYAVDFLIPSAIVGGILSVCGALAVRRYLQAGSMPILILGTLAIVLALVLWSAAGIYMPRDFSIVSDGETYQLRTRGRSFTVDEPLRVSSVTLNRVPMYWVTVSTSAGKIRLLSRDNDVANKVYDLLSAPPPAP